MNGAPLAYGIDFGTSNSQIALAWADRTEVVSVGGRRVAENLPSVIYLNRDGNQAAGDDAIEQYLVSAGVDSRLLVGIKSDLADPSFKSTQSWGYSWTPPELVAVVMLALKRAADRHTGHTCRRVVLGHPVAFVGTEGPDYDLRQETAMKRLIESARLAGFEEIDTLEEPSAAAQDEDPGPGGILVALDFGGGTFDVAVVDYGRDPAEVIGLQGAAIGGERFDQLLFNAKVAPELGLLEEYGAPDGSRHRLPARVMAGSRSMLDLRSLLLDYTLPEILRRFQTFTGGERLVLLEQLLYGGFAYSFFEAVEDAKIRLSVDEQTTIQFRGGGFDMSVPVTRIEFESLIENDIALIEATIQNALADAGVTAASATRVIRTGGSSSIPLFVDMVMAMFGSERMVQRPPFTAVVQGLASYSQMVWS